MSGKIRKIIVLTLCGSGLFCCIAYFALFLLLQSPAVLNYFASKFGYEISAGDISFSPDLSGRIEDLKIKDADSGITVVCSDVTVRNLFTMLLKGQIDSLVLRNPKLTLRSGRSSDKNTDLSFLGKLPDVRLLDIQNAEIDYLTGDEQEIKLVNFNLTVMDFSPKKGGHISLQSNFSYKSDAGKKVLSVHDISLVTKFVYDKSTETFTVESMDGKSKEFGTIKAAAKVVTNDSMPWNLNLAISSMDFAKVFGVVQPFLPEDLKRWTIKGKGDIEAALQGTYADKQPSFSGPITLSFRETGANSPDSSISAQGDSGTVVLKVNYSAPEHKLAFNFYSVQQHGELLWKDYYNNFKGQQTFVTANGAFVLTQDFPFTWSAKLDIFQTGDYLVSMRGNRRDWSIKALAHNVSHEKVIEKMLKEYLSSNTAGLKGFSATGFSSLETTTRHNEGTTYVSGVYKMADTAINAPDMELSIRNISVDLPFDLVQPSSARQKQLSVTPGHIRFTDIQRKRLNIENLHIPVVIAQNMLEVPERVVIPFYSGKIHIYDVMVDDFLSPDMQVRFGLKIENINLGRLTQRLLKQELPGTINADFGVMKYQNDGLKSEGTAMIDVFDGEIKASNFFAQDISRPSRKFGGDITIKDINLEEMTRKIAIGRMSGIIQGSLKGFAMEYDEPASFILEVESVEKAGISQEISADAIDNISILGTGAGSVLSKGVTKYFKNFPYSRIGFRCVLRNDQFRVNGTIIEGDTEYLVRRGLFRGVDVINQNRNNVISFRDMEERLKRISHHEKATSDEMLVQ